MYLRRLVGCGILLLALICLVELSLLKSGHSVSGKPVIRVGCSSWQKGEFPLKDFIAAWQHQHPGVEVQLNIIPRASENKLSMLWQRGTTPYDVVISFADEEIHSFIRQNLLSDMNELLPPESLASFLPSSLAGSTLSKDGSSKTYLLPFTMEMMVLNVRHDLFRITKAASPPETWAQLHQLASAHNGLSEPGGRKIWPLACDLSQGFMFGQNLYIPMLAAVSNGKLTDDRGRLRVSGPHTEKVFTEIKGWYQQGLISPSMKIDGQADRDFAGGLALTYPHWQSRGILAARKLPKASIKIWPVPGAREHGSLVSCYGAIIPRCSPVRKEAARFALECFSQWMQPSVITDGRMSPLREIYQPGFPSSPDWLLQLRKDATNEKWFSSVDQSWTRFVLPPWVVELKPAIEKGYTFPDHLMWPRINQEIALAFQKYLNSPDPSPKKQLAELQKIVDQIYEHEKK